MRLDPSEWRQDEARDATPVSRNWDGGWLGARPVAQLPVGTARVSWAVEVTSAADRSRDLPPLKAERGRGATVLALKWRRRGQKGRGTPNLSLQ